MNDMSHPESRSNMPPTPIQADAVLSANLQAQEWNVVFTALNELPMRVSRPVFDKLMAQFNQTELR